MENINNKLIISGILMVLIFVFGFLVSGRGKPYNPFIFGIHKLVSLGFLIFLSINISKLNRISPLSPITSTVCILVGVLFFLTMVTGGIVSIEKEIHKIFTTMHKLLPYPTALFSIVSFFFLWQKN